jgi:hypothetical protein
MKKGQLSIYIIVGLIVIALAVGFFALRDSDDRLEVLDEEKDEQTSFSADKVSFQNYFDECAKLGVLQTNQVIGIDPELETAYEDYVTRYIDSCMSDFVTQLEARGLEVVKETTTTDLTITDDVVSLEINYPAEVSDEATKFSFNEYETTLSRTQTIKLNGGIANEEVVILSTDKNTKIIIPAGTKVTDENGNPVEEVSLRILEKHFEGLDNSATIGKLLYQGLPEGAQFSEPIEMVMTVRSEDLPDMMSEHALSIAWWDGYIWRALPTSVNEEGSLSANVDHFTAFSIATCNDIKRDGSNKPEGSPNMEITTPLLYQQEFEYRQLTEEIKEQLEDDKIESKIEEYQNLYSTEEEKTPDIWKFQHGSWNFWAGFESIFMNPFSLDGLRLGFEFVDPSASTAPLMTSSPILSSFGPLPTTVSGTPGPMMHEGKLFSYPDGFCLEPTEDDSAWKMDREAVVPKKEEFMKVLFNEDDRIVRSISMMSNEIRQFGTNRFLQCNQPREEQKTTRVTPYCCCWQFAEDDFRCYNEVMGEQQCYERLKQDEYLTDPDTFEDDTELFSIDDARPNPNDVTVYDSDSEGKTNMYSTGDAITNWHCGNVFADADEIYTEKGEDVIDREIYGYNDINCVNGLLKDAGTEGGNWRSDNLEQTSSVYEIRFAPGGASCYAGSTVVYETLNGDSCEGPESLSGPLELSYPDQRDGEDSVIAYVLNEVTTSNRKGMCADCYATITLLAKEGTFFSPESERHFSCTANENNDYKLIYNGGLPECRVCVQSNVVDGLSETELEGQYVYIIDNEEVYNTATSDKCDIKDGCGDCLKYPQSESIDGLCTPTHQGDKFCNLKNDGKGYLCNNGALQVMTSSEYEDLCYDCLNNPSSSEDCVEVV